MWLLGLLSAAILAGAIYLGHEWYARSWGWNDGLQQSVFAPDLGWNEPTWMLLGALLLGLIAVAGGPIIKAIMRLTKKRGEDPRQGTMTPVAQQRLQRPDGSEVQVKMYGPADAPPLVLTHGWGLNSDEWAYAHRELAQDFRVIVWDEPGLGASKRPANGDFGVEKFARDLEAVLGLAGDRPAILIGHSIGGMITLTFCRLFPEALGTRVAGLVLTHTTYTNPVRTTQGAGFLTAIEKPVLVPLMYLTMVLSPLVWFLGWLSYRNGTAHLLSMSSSFAGTETWEQIEFSAHFQPKASPWVLARGMLGMMSYDATATLKMISVPTLVVAGDQDSTCKPEASERMQQDIPGARQVTLTPARHLGLIEHHERYAQSIREFARTSLAAKQTPGAEATTHSFASIAHSLAR